MEAYVKSNIENGIGTIEFFHPQSNSMPSSQLKNLVEEINNLGKNDNCAPSKRAKPRFPPKTPFSRGNRRTVRPPYATFVTQKGKRANKAHALPPVAFAPTFSFSFSPPKEEKYVAFLFYEQSTDQSFLGGTRKYTLCRGAA